MITLTPESIKDFQICERLYDYRHVEKTPETIYSRDLTNIKFENSINNIIQFFWFKKQGGITPSYSSLLNRWEKIWFPKNADYYDIMTEQHESAYGNMASMTSQAANLLMRFHETYSEMNIIPLSISEEYTYNLTKTIRIQDKIDIVYRKGIENFVSKIIFNYKSNNRHLYQINFAIMYMIFENHYKDYIKNTKFGYIDLMSNDLSFKEYEITQEDIDSVNYWCDTIESKEIFVPRRGLIAYCKKCPFDKPCSKWSGWKNNE